MATSELRRKQDELKRKIEKTERAQWKGRYKSQLFELERQHYRKIIEKTESKAVKSKYEKAIKRSYRRQTAIKSYEKRVKKGTDALSTFTKEQRAEFAAKAVQTRIENKLKKQEWEGLTHGQKISRGIKAAREKKLKRQEAGRKAAQTRKYNEAMQRLEASRAIYNIIDILTRTDDKARERTRENEGTNDERTDLDKLADIYLAYGEFASEKVNASLSRNPEFQKKLAEKIVSRTSSQELKDMFSRPSSIGYMFLEKAVQSRNFYDVLNPYDSTRVKEVSHAGLSASDWMKKSMAADIERERQERLYQEFEKFRRAIQGNQGTRVAEGSKKINFEYKPGKKWN